MYMYLIRAAKVILYRQGLILKLNIVYINLKIHKKKNMEKELETWIGKQYDVYYNTPFPPCAQ